MPNSLARAVKMASASIVIVASLLGSGAFAADKVPVKVVMNFVMNGQFLPIIVAKQNGYYADAGLDVNVEEGKSSSVSAQLVATGQADFGYADGPTGMQVAAKGAPIKTVISLFATNPFALVSLASSNIKTAKDLIGKKVGVSAGGAQMVLIPKIDEVNGLTGKYTLIPMDGSAQNAALLQGQVDAIHVAADKAIALEDKGAKVNLLYLRDIGAPTVGPGLVANTSLLEQHPDVVRKFLAATIKGLNAAYTDPKSAADAAHAFYPQLSADQFLAQLNAVKPFVCAQNSTSLGKSPQASWDLSRDLLAASGSLPSDAKTADYFTYDFLPTDLPACPKQ